MSGDLDRILIGGRERREISIVDYDTGWAERYTALRAPLVEALAGVAVRIDHIGSTAVPGLPAKPILDLQVAVAEPDREASFGPALLRLGYELRVREQAHRMYRTPALGVHLHVWRAGSEDERRHLLFRDWLRRTPEDRDRYAAVKRALAEQEWGDMNEYADAKTPVIEEILTRAEAWAKAGGWTLPRPIEAG